MTSQNVVIVIRPAVRKSASASVQSRTFPVLWVATSPANYPSIKVCRAKAGRFSGSRLLVRGVDAAYNATFR